MRLLMQLDLFLQDVHVVELQQDLWVCCNHASLWWSCWATLLAYKFETCFFIYNNNIRFICAIIKLYHYVYLYYLNQTSQLVEIK